MKEIIPAMLEILTLVSDVALVLILLVAGVVFLRKREFSRVRLFSFAYRHVFLLAFIVSLTATLGSLYYSEIMGYAPCTLCWYQRIFMYPQALLFGIALFFRKREELYTYIATSSIVLSSVGLLLAGYHYLAQVGAVSTTCTVVGYSAQCSELFFVQYGYITIPMMALTSFALLILLGANASRRRYSF